ncbi:MAG: hypothetical protein IPO21_04210 [Bacteroidales bacterium]|nr:hypothetical protein [Bacteroidales bacterium]
MTDKNFCIFNGEIFKTSELSNQFDLSNFQSITFYTEIRLIDTTPLFLNEHFDYLLATHNFYKIALPTKLDIEKAKTLITRLLNVNKVYKGGCAKLEFFYNKEKKMCDYLIFIHPLHSNQFAVKENGISITSFKERICSDLPIRNIKSRFDIIKHHSRHNCDNQGFDECFYYSNELTICSSSGGQVAVVVNDTIYFQNNTADLQFLILATKLIDILNLNKICYKTNIEITENVLLNADEVFLIDDIQGIRWVQKFKNRRYINKTSKQLTSLLNDSVKNKKSN